MNRPVANRLRVEFDGPDVSQEMLYTLFRVSPRFYVVYVADKLTSLMGEYPISYRPPLSHPGHCDMQW